MLRYFLIITTLTISCSSPHFPKILYPSAEYMEVKYICNLPYSKTSSRGKLWSKSTPVWIFLDKSKVVVYFENDSSFLMSRNENMSLPPGKYSCGL